MTTAPVSHRAARVRRALAPAVAAVALAAPGGAAAAAPPTILTAGIDAEDQLYATWSLPAGTAFEHMDFATVPTAAAPGYFDVRHFAGFDCAESYCDGNPRSTSHTGSYPIARDRRYFVKVTGRAGGDSATSAVWVIDETKPVIPGVAPVGDIEPSHAPVAGRPFDGASLLAPGTVSTASIAVSKLPKTVHGLLVAGVRVRVTCSVACGFEGILGVGDTELATKETGYARGGSRTLVFRVPGTHRARLRRRSSSRLELEATVTPLEGTTRHVLRRFRVHR